MSQRQHRGMLFKGRMRTCLVFIFFTACGSTNPEELPHQHAPITEVRFRAKAGAGDFTCGQSVMLGSPATAYAPKDLRFYVSEVALVTEDGVAVPFTMTPNSFQSASIGLLDFEDGTGGCSDGTAEVHTTLTGNATGGHYHALQFTLGLPFSQNHQDATVAAAPLDRSAMFWNWQSGYRFLKLEGTTAGMPGGHFMHLGSTGCTPGSTPNSVADCTARNTVSIELHDFNAATSTVVLDVEALLSGSDLSRDTGGAPGCMSGAADADCSAIFARLGLRFGAAAAQTQSAFRLE